MTFFEPRNISAARRARERSSQPLGPAIVISLVGETQLRFPHIYVDPGRRYDYSAVRHAQCLIATRPGVNASQALAEVFAEAERGFFCSGFPYLVDVEGESLAHVWSISPVQYRPHHPGSRTWAACFG